MDAFWRTFQIPAFKKGWLVPCLSGSFCACPEEDLPRAVGNSHPTGPMSRHKFQSTVRGRCRSASLLPPHTFLGGTVGQSSRDSRSPEFTRNLTLLVPRSSQSEASWDLLARRFEGAKVCTQQQKMPLTLETVPLCVSGRTP